MRGKGRRQPAGDAPCLRETGSLLCSHRRLRLGAGRHALIQDSIRGIRHMREGESLIRTDSSRFILHPSFVTRIEEDVNGE